MTIPPLDWYYDPYIKRPYGNLKKPAYTQPPLPAKQAAKPKLSPAEDLADRFSDALRRDDLRSVETLLEQGADVDMPLRNGFTPLHNAISLHRKETVRLLIDSGADVNKRSGPNQSYPLITALCARNADIACMLIEAGAERNAKERNLFTVPHLAARQAAEGDTRVLKCLKIQEALYGGIASGDCDKMRKIIDDAFWRGERIKFNWRHLKIALEREDKPMMRLLITWGAKPSSERVEKALTSQERALLQACGLKMTPAPAAGAPHAPKAPAP